MIQIKFILKFRAFLKTFNLINSFILFQKFNIKKVFCHTKYSISIKIQINAFAFQDFFTYGLQTQVNDVRRFDQSLSHFISSVVPSEPQQIHHLTIGLKNIPS